MKKASKYMAMLLIGAGLLSASCQSKHEARLNKVETVTEKINEEKEISQEEYGATFEYMEGAYTEMLELIDKRDTMNPREFIAAVQELSAKYPYGEQLEAYFETEPENLSEENKVRYEKMLKAREALRSIAPKLGTPIVERPAVAPEAGSEDSGKNDSVAKPEPMIFDEEIDPTRVRR